MLKTVGFYCTSKAWGGLEMSVLSQAQWLTDAGLTIKILTVFESKLGNSCKQADLPTLATAVHRKYFAFAQAKQLAALCRRNEVEILVVFHNHDLDTAVWAKRLFAPRLRLCYQQHMQIGTKPKKNFFHWLRQSAIDRWITPLPSMAADTLRKTYLKKEQMALVPLGIAPPKDEPILPKLRNQLGIPEWATVIGILGRIDPQKGQDLLIEAAAKWQNPAMHIIIMGAKTEGEGGIYEVQLRKKVAECGLTTQVHFCGFAKETAAFFQSIDVFVLTSHCETYGLVTLEAMCYGVPVVGSNCGGTLAFIGDNERGWLFETRSAEALLLSLKLCLEQTDERRKRTAMAKIFVEKGFSQQATLDAWKDLLARL